MRSDSTTYLTYRIRGNVPLATLPVEIGLRGVNPATGEAFYPAAWVAASGTVNLGPDGVTVVAYEMDAQILIGPPGPPSTAVHLAPGAYAAAYRIVSSPEIPAVNLGSFTVEPGPGNPTGLPPGDLGLYLTASQISVLLAGKANQPIQIGDVVGLTDALAAGGGSTVSTVGVDEDGFPFFDSDGVINGGQVQLDSGYPVLVIGG